MTRSLLRSVFALSLAASAVALAAPVQAAPTGVAAKPSKPPRSGGPHVKVFDGTTLMASPDGEIVVEAKGKLTLVLQDAPDAFIYAVVLPPDGGPGKVCKRSATPGGAAGKCSFKELTFVKKTDTASAAAAVHIQVMAITRPTSTATAEQTPKIKYGPVITVKPKG